MRRERIEDLGVIKEKLNRILEDCLPLEKAQSKHSIDHFCEFYGDSRNMEELYDHLRWLKEELWDIYEIAAGEDYDDTD